MRLESLKSFALDPQFVAEFEPEVKAIDLNSKAPWIHRDPVQMDL